MAWTDILSLPSTGIAEVSYQTQLLPGFFFLNEIFLRVVKQPRDFTHAK